MKAYVYKFLLTVFTSILLFSCGEELLVEPRTDVTSGFVFLPDNSISTSEVNQIRQKDFVSLGDLSLGDVSRTWTLSSGNFLKSNFRASDTLGLKSFIDTNKGKSTSDNIVHVLFDQGGMQSVTYRGIFPIATDVRFSNDTISTVKNSDGKWEVSKVYQFEVFPDPVPSFIVTQEDVEITENKIVIEAGESLVFTDLNTETSIGLPNTRTWRFNGGSVETSRAQSVEVFFNSLGTFRAGSITTTRSAPLRTDVLKIIDLEIEVIPSTKPYVVVPGSLVADMENNNIEFKVGGEIQSLATGEIKNFTVRVVNPDAGFNEKININAIKIDSDDKTKIVLSVDPLFNTDQVTITYNPTTDPAAPGGIRSVDERLLQSFVDEEVLVPLGENILPEDWATFGSASTINETNRWKAADAFGYWVGNGNNSPDNPVYLRSTERGANRTPSSMSYTHREGLNSVRLQGTNFNRSTGAEPYEAGTYRVSYEIFRESANIVKMTNTNALNIDWDLSAVPLGEWTTVTQDVVVASAIAVNRRLDTNITLADNPAMVKGDKIYFDELKFIKINPRE
ncbi:hypothetical protein ACXGQW_02870 [Wenyingzhuangia sp. IMCC45533]